MSSFKCGAVRWRAYLWLAAAGLPACDPWDDRDATEIPDADLEQGSVDGGFANVDAGIGFIGFLPFLDAGAPLLVQPGALPPRLESVQSQAVKPPPIFGGTLSVSPDEAFLVAADPDRDTVQVIERATHTVRTLALPPRSRPFRAQIGADGVAHVVLRGTGSLLRLTLADAAPAGSLPVCPEPRGVALAAAGGTLAVACASGELVSVDAASYAVRGRTQLDPDLRDVVPRADGGFYVSRFRSAELIQVGTDGLAVGRSKGAAALSAVAEPPLSDGSVPPRASAAAWRSVAMVDGKVAMLHQNSQDTLVAEQPGGYGGFGCPITTGGVTLFGPDGTPAGYMPVQLGGANVDVSLSPDASLLAVASPSGYGIASPTISVYFSQAQPLDEAFPPSTCTGFPSITAGTDLQVTSVVFGPSGTLYALSREPASLSEFVVDLGTFQLALRQRLSLSDSSVRDTGHDLFHADVGSGLACVSCHGEAEDDGHVWNLGTSGPRRTQHLRGGVLARAPFHWSGDLATMQSLMDEVMTARMTGFGMDAAHTAALGAWLDAQPALLPSVVDEASVARGKALFESQRLACASCHAGADLSSSAPVDVGTGGAFKVPTLRGIALRPPYMHDGCAKTLRERFEPSCGGERHGDTSELTAGQLDDLIAYLTSL